MSCPNNYGMLTIYRNNFCYQHLHWSSSIVLQNYFLGAFFIFSLVLCYTVQEHQTYVTRTKFCSVCTYDKLSLAANIMTLQFRKLDESAVECFLFSFVILFHNAVRLHVLTFGVCCFIGFCSLLYYIWIVDINIGLPFAFP